MGSRRAARSAGSRTAATATKQSALGMPAKMTGSYGLNPLQRDPQGAKVRLAAVGIAGGGPPLIRCDDLAFDVDVPARARPAKRYVDREENGAHARKSLEPPPQVGIEEAEGVGRRLCRYRNAELSASHDEVFSDLRVTRTGTSAGGSGSGRVASWTRPSGALRRISSQTPGSGAVKISVQRPGVCCTVRGR